MAAYPLIKSIEDTEWDKECATNTTLQEYRKLLESREKGLQDQHKALLWTAASMRDINQTHAMGETILHWASSREYQDSYKSPLTGVYVLLLLGAKPDVQDKLGQTPLHWAVTRGHERHNRISDLVVHDLLEFGASANVTDTSGATPLCLARWNRVDELADILDPLTDQSLITRPSFVLENRRHPGDIRRSTITRWIQEETRDLEKNRERLCDLMCTPGTGIIHHPEEVQHQEQQIMTLLNRISAEISRDDPLFTFTPHLVGSSAENTKCGAPDEKDVIISFSHLIRAVRPERCADDQRDFARLRVTADITGIAEKYIWNGYLNRAAISKDFNVKFIRALSAVSVWNTAELSNLYLDDTDVETIALVRDEGDVHTVGVVWCGQWYKYIKVSVDIVPAIPLVAGIEQKPLVQSDDQSVFAVLKSKAQTCDYDDNDDVEMAASDTGESLLAKPRTFHMQSHVEDISFSDTDNDSNEEWPSDISSDIDEIQEETRQEGRLYARKTIDIADDLFYLSYCGTELKAMKSLPENVRFAYVLSKALVDFIPEIRATANKGIHPDWDYYEGRKDIFSYMLKMALLQAYHKYQCEYRAGQRMGADDRVESVEDCCDNEVENVGNRKKKQCSLTFDSTRQSGPISGHASSLEVDTHMKDAKRDMPSISSKTETYPATKSALLNDFAPALLSTSHQEPNLQLESLRSHISSNIDDISLWVDRIFSELEEAASRKHLPVFFDPARNVLDKVIALEQQTGFPYPALKYLRTHCKMARALVRI